MIKIIKASALTLIAFCVMFSASNATAAPDSKQIKCYKKLATSDYEFDSKTEMVAWFQSLVDSGCIRKNPVLTTEADIRTNSDYCVAYAKAANPLLSKKVVALKRINRLEWKGGERLGKIIRPYYKRMDKLYKFDTKAANREIRRLLKVVQKIDLTYTRSAFYKSLTNQRFIAANAATLQVINLFVEGCLENEGFQKNLNYLNNRLFYENAALFKAFSYEENEIRLATVVAKQKVNMFYKTAKSEAATSNNGNYPGLKRINQQSYGEFKAVKATKDFVLNQGVEGPIYITKLGPHIICASQLIYTKDGDKYFLNTQIKHLPDYWVDKNMIRCAK